MDFYKEIEFRKHLLKVCRDRELRGVALDYFKDLSEKFEGQNFTKANFETLLVDGKEIEQDVVKEVFATKEEASAEEIFLYLFKSNVQKIKAFNLSVFSLDPRNGCYNHDEKTVEIGQKNFKELFSKRYSAVLIDRPEGMSDKEWKKYLKAEEKKIAKEDRINNKARKKLVEMKIETDAKHVMYHELSHVFEIKTFENRKYRKVGISNEIFADVNKGLVLINDKQNITKDDVKNAKIIEDGVRYFDESSPKDSLRFMIKEGAVSISEIFNEEFACLIDDSLNIKKNENITYKDKLVKKAYLEGDCAYNINYDISMLLKLAIGDVDYKDLRFNSKKLIEKVNNLNISATKLQSVQEQFLNNLTKTNFCDEFKFSKADFNKELKTCGVFDTIAAMVHVSDKFGEQFSADFCRYGSNYKAIVQDLLIESIKNDIILEINNPNLVKDAAYFEKIDSKLKTIDQFILYPNVVVSFFSREVFGELAKNELFITSVGQYANKYADRTHITNFNELINEVKKCANQNNINLENMSFFKEQKEIEENRIQLEKESELIKKERELAKYGSHYTKWMEARARASLRRNTNQNQDGLNKVNMTVESNNQENNTTSKEAEMGSGW